MNLKSYFLPLIRWWWLIVASMILAVISSTAIVANQPLKYSAHTTLLIGRMISNPNPSSNDFFLSQQLAGLYINMAMTEPVKNATKQNLGLSRLPDYNVISIGNGQFVKIEVTDTNPERAMKVAQELANQLIDVTPTGTQRVDATRQAFVNDQINDFQTQINDIKKQIADKQSSIGSLQSAHEIAQAKQDIADLQNKLSLLQTNYASLVSTTQTNAENTLQVIEPATLPTIPVGPSKMVIILIAGVMGLVMPAGVVYLIDFVDGTLKTPEEIQKKLKLTIIGYILDMGKKYQPIPYVYRNPRSPMSEAYRSLRANLEFQDKDKRLKTILVTSPDSGDGKTTVAINLAFSYVQSGKKVIIIDSDLRRPTVHRYLNLPEHEGWSDVLEGKVLPENVLLKWNDTKLNDILEGKVNLEDAVVKWNSDSKMSVLTAGTSVEEIQDELLDSDNIEGYLSAVKELADLVIIDSSPFLVTDAMFLANKVDGIVLVIRPGVTHKELVQNMIEKISRTGGKIMGIVLNRIPNQYMSTYTEYRYYSPYYVSKYASSKKNGKPSENVDHLEGNPINEGYEGFVASEGYEEDSYKEQTENSVLTEIREINTDQEGIKKNGENHKSGRRRRKSLI